MNTENLEQKIKNKIYADGKERAEAMRVIEEAVTNPKLSKCNIGCSICLIHNDMKCLRHDDEESEEE